MSKVDEFVPATREDVSDASLLIRRFDALCRDVVDLRDSIERLHVSIEASGGDMREIHREITSIVALVGRLHDRFEARANAADARLDAITVTINRNQLDIGAINNRITSLEIWRETQIELRVKKKRSSTRAKKRSRTQAKTLSR